MGMRNHFDRHLLKFYLVSLSRGLAVVAAWVFVLGTQAILSFTALSWWPGTGRNTSTMSVNVADGVLHVGVGFHCIVCC